MSGNSPSSEKQEARSKKGTAPSKNLFFKARQSYLVLRISYLTQKAPAFAKAFCLFVGTTRFELATPCTPCKCATGLRYVPNNWGGKCKIKS